jgi:hypothetical protein
MVAINSAGRTFPLFQWRDAGAAAIALVASSAARSRSIQ